MRFRGTKTPTPLPSGTAVIAPAAATSFSPRISGFLSTSKGANAYFSTLFTYGQGQRKDRVSWHRGTIDNPFIPASEGMNQKDSRTGIPDEASIGVYTMYARVNIRGVPVPYNNKLLIKSHRRRTRIGRA